MRILTLWEPWATLIAIGEKRIETRSWGPSSPTGPIAIQAAKRPADLDVITTDPFRLVLESHGYGSPNAFHYGAVLCVTHLVDVVATDGLEMARVFSGQVRAGRFAWLLATPVPLLADGLEPLVVKGSRGLWSPTLDVQRQIVDRMDEVAKRSGRKVGKFPA